MYLTQTYIIQVYIMKKGKTMKALIFSIAMALTISVSCLLAIPLMSDVSLAEQTPEDDPIVLQNDEGGQVIIDVEEELPADSKALKEQEEAAGVVNMEEDAVPLAGFSEVAPAKDAGDIHLVWMVLLLAAALAYIAYFTSYQKKLFDLRRSIADAEFEIRKEVGRHDD